VEIKIININPNLFTYRSWEAWIEKNKRVFTDTSPVIVNNEPTKIEIKSKDIEVEESEYKLESTYAHDQLCFLADELAEITFMFLMRAIFGDQIEVEAISKLYRDLSDRKIQSPEIIISKFLVGKYGRLAGYSNKQKKIIVNENFLEEATQDNDKRAELLAVLVEEYGHHIDNLLRTELATNGKKDEDILDEGAKFAYQLFKFDIFKESSLEFASAETPTFGGNLIVDFSKLHTSITQYVNETQQYDEIPGIDTPNYGAGRSYDKNGAYSHGDIEFKALANSASPVFTNKQVTKIYYGNWLRDFSQVIVGITVRSTNHAALLQEKYDIEQETVPMKLSHEGWVSLIEILAIKEFLYDHLLEEGKEVPNDYKILKKKFVEEFGELDKDVLGLYRPEEHIDNPKGLGDESKIKDDKGNVVSFNYEGATKTLYAGDNNLSWKIDDTRNMSNFFWVDFPHRPSSVTYLKEQIRLACKNGQTNKGFHHLGAALHVLEDFFAHTNFVEIAMRKHRANVYPWIETYKGKNYKNLPVISGTFLSEDTIASLGPKVADILFSTEMVHYERREPEQRTLSETFLLTTLRDLAKGQASDPAKTNSSYLGVEHATWLEWLETYLSFQDYLAAEYKKADDLDWLSGDFFEKLGAKTMETIEWGMNYTGQFISYLPRLVFGLIFDSFDEIVPIVQSQNNSNYGNNPSHSQVAKDSETHLLNQLSAELAMIAVEDVGKKFKAGWSGNDLAKYVADTYFVHPMDEKANWCDDKILRWITLNPNAVEKLKFKHTHKHFEDKVERITKEEVQWIKEIMEYFKQ